MAQQGSNTHDPQTRRRARERAVQFLFGLDFTLYEWESAIEDFWAENPSKPGVRQYADYLIEGVIDHREALDTEIAASLDNWNPDRVGRIERNIIRIALFEIRYGLNMPPNVAINEAIEVAKRYGADEAPRFVNGVLDRLRKGRGAQTSEKDEDELGMDAP